MTFVLNLQIKAGQHETNTISNGNSRILQIPNCNFTNVNIDSVSLKELQTTYLSDRNKKKHTQLNRFHKICRKENL